MCPACPRVAPAPTRAETPARPRPEPVEERAFLPNRPGLLAALVRGADALEPGAWDVVEPPATLAGLPAGDVILCHLRNVAWHPVSGVVCDDAGRFPAAPAEQARRMPAPPRAGAGRLPRLERAAIWASQGARENFGHYIFDALTGLHFMAAHSLLDRFPAVSAPLGNWQRDLLAAAGLAGRNREIGADWIAVDELVYVSTMAHYLQRNGGLLHALARAFRPQPPAAPPAGAPVYLSRRGYSGRIMVNEPMLERALAAEGARIVQSERLTVAEQMALMHATSTLIGPSGAALANLCFLTPGARVIELRPPGLGETWIEIATANLGLGHRILRGEGPLTASEIPLRKRLAQLPRRLSGRYAYAFRMDVPAVMATLRAG